MDGKSVAREDDEDDADEEVAGERVVEAEKGGVL